MLNQPLPPGIHPLTLTLHSPTVGMVYRKFYAFNATDTSKDTLVIGHPFKMEMCKCVMEEDPACVYYNVGYDVVDFCTALGLDPERPVYLSSAPTTALSVDDDAVYYGPVLLIPVHGTTPVHVGFQN